MSRWWLGVLTFIAAVATAAAAADDWRFPATQRVVAISDVHGADVAFVETLAAARVIDANGRWVGGTTRLVVIGDLLDRGPGSRAVMDLLRRLEGEAAGAGGAVHLTLGNHEMMNLVGDLRYVSAAEYAAFAADETTAERDAAFARYLARRSDEDPAQARAAFDASYPPGYFAHRRAFSANGEYGAWLLDKPALVVIGETAFVHGGLPAAVADDGAAALNTETQAVLREYLDGHRQLVDAGVLSGQAAFYDQPELIDAFMAANPDCCTGVAAIAERVKALNASRVFDERGILWYRGTAACPGAIEDARLAAALARLGAQRVVIGHTPNPRGVRSRLNGRVIRVDTGILHEYYGGIGAALVIEGDDTTVVYQDGTITAVRAEVGGVPSALEMTRAQLEKALESAQLSAPQEESPDGVQRRSATLGGYQLSVDFIPGGRHAKTFLPDVAAYRLDQLLGTDLVPVTVAREVDGQRGSLRLMARRTVSEAQRLEARGSAYCPLRDQFQAMYVIDALMDQRRATETLLYAPGSWSLVLIGHGNAFGTSRAIPKHLEPVVTDLAPAWRERLEPLDEASLEAALGDVLDRRRIGAVLKRRDRMLR